MRDVSGLKVLCWCGPVAIRRHSQVLPSFGTLSWIVRRGSREYYMRWVRWHGVSVDAWRWVSKRSDPLAWTDFGGPVPMSLIKRTPTSTPLTMPDLPASTVLLRKLPTLNEFLTRRSWPDGTARVPGRFWFDPSASGFALTLIDVDQCLRLVVRAGTIEDVFAAAELALGAESGPWEIDQYHAEKRAEKGRKKK